MKKKITIRPASQVRTSIEQEIDQWVISGKRRTNEEKPEVPEVEEGETEEFAEQQKKLYRLSLDIPLYLHRRIKKTCAIEGISMKEKLTKLLLDSFPER